MLESVCLCGTKLKKLESNICFRSCFRCMCDGGVGGLRVGI